MKVALCKLDEIPAEGAKVVDFFGREVLVMNVEGRPKAVLNICLHLGGPMVREGEKLVCQWHRAEFDCQSGRRLKEPAPPDSRLIMLPVRVDGDALYYVYGE